MFPGMNPRDVEKAMRRMGVKQEEVNAEQVIVKCKDRNLIFDNPSFVKVNMMGQVTFQLSGDFHEESIDETPDITEEDIKTVVSQAKVSEKEAKEALVRNKGDIAKTIIELRNKP